MDIFCAITGALLFSSASLAIVSFPSFWTLLMWALSPHFSLGCLAHPCENPRGSVKVAWRAMDLTLNQELIGCFLAFGTCFDTNWAKVLNAKT